MESAPENPGAGWQLKGAARESYVRAMFDTIAEPYDRLNRVISLGRDHAWRRRVVERAAAGPGARVLDLGTGTGDLAFAMLARVLPGGCVLGLDLAEAMLARAEEKRRARGAAHVEFRKGNAAATGEPDGSADAVTMGWVLRNVADRPSVYREILRVLKPGGRFVAIDMSHPEGPLAKSGFWLYRHLMMPVLARIAGGDRKAYRYLASSTDGFPGAVVLAEELRAAGFEGVSYERLMMGSLAVHVGVKAGTTGNRR